jgi:hypothetical protein
MIYRPTRHDVIPILDLYKPRELIHVSNLFIFYFLVNISSASLPAFLVSFRQPKLP